MKRTAPPRHPPTLLLMFTCALLAVATTVGCGGSFEDPLASLAPFKDSVDAYLKPFTGGGNVKVYTQYGGKPQGYIKGGVVLIEDKAVTIWNTHLPRSLRATSPDDVGTVVVIRTSSHKVGTYSGGEPALQSVWKVTVADLARGKVVGRALLRGDHPPVVADVAAGENHGPPPWDELLAYLNKLPQR